MTLPYLTTENEIFFLPLMLFEDINNLSEHNFDAPYKLTGDTALSVDNEIVFSTLLSIAASTTFCDPTIFVFITSKGLYSPVGTCFNAAECTIKFTSFVAQFNLSLSLTSPIKYLSCPNFLSLKSKL